MQKSIYFLLACLFITSCKKPGNATTAFYYWKAGFKLDPAQKSLLNNTNTNRLYVRFFDVNWSDDKHQAYPNAIVHFDEPLAGINIIPVIYITNKTFENLPDTAVNTLAIHCNRLINYISSKQHIINNTIQIDCDWTLTTRNKYFNFLKSLKATSHKSLQATIRLHQVKYKETTGVPPVDKGVLMFYNMGTLNANLKQPNSIYNRADADKYVRYVGSYPLKLDVALPLFSWALQIRNGKLIQVYGKINRTILSQNNFEPTAEKSSFRAKQSFFLSGIYIKQNDIFKLEEMDAESLKTAAGQLTKYLPKQQNLTIIYYELATINLPEFNAETIKDISGSL